MSSSHKREIIFHSTCLEDFRFWVESDRKVALRILDLIEATFRDPFRGIGKPEPLGAGLKGLWSRRITAEHRLVYEVAHERIAFVQARFHYKR